MALSRSDTANIVAGQLWPLYLGDDALILGQRLIGWCGHGPSLEIDVALSNISLDMIGQAQALLSAAAETRSGSSADDLAFGRDAHRFTNCLLVEQPNGDFARTIARQLLFSQWQSALLDTVLDGGVSLPLSDLAPKMRKEVQRHLDFACEWTQRLGDGTDESHLRLGAGLSWCARFVDELFEPLAPLDEPMAQTLRERFDTAVTACLRSAGFAALPRPPQVRGGRCGRHSEHLGVLLAEMQVLPRSYPGAVW